MRRLYAALFVLLAFVAVAFAADDDIARLYTFSSGNVISSSEMNGEFNQLISTINTKVSRSGVNTISGNNTHSGNNTFSGENTFSNSTAPIKVDKILERTSDGGVTIDGLLLKDGYLRPTKASDPTPAEGDVWYNSTDNALRFYNGVATQSIYGGLPQGHISGPVPVYATSATITLKSGMRVRSSDNTADIILDADKTCDLSASGAGGLGTGSEASGTWYYVYAILDIDTGTEACLLSVTNEADTGSVTMPSGYDKKRQLRLAIRNDGSSNIVPFYMTDDGWVQYEVTFSDTGTAAGPTSVLDAGTASTFTNVDLTSYVPPIALKAKLFIDSTASGTHLLNVRKDGESHNGLALSTGAAAEHAQGIFEMNLPSTRIVEYKTNGSAPNVNIAVVGWKATEVN